MTEISPIPRQIDEIEQFLSKAERVVDRIKVARRGVSSQLFRETHADLARISRLIACWSLENDSKRKQQYLKKTSTLCILCFRNLLKTQIKFCVDECESFRNDYRRIPIGEIVKDYQRDCQVLKNTEEMLADLDRGEDVSTERLKQVFHDMSAILKRWNAARPELNKKDKPSFLAATVGCLGLLATVITVGGFLWWILKGLFQLLG